MIWIFAVLFACGDSGMNNKLEEKGGVHIETQTTEQQKTTEKQAEEQKTTPEKAEKEETTNTEVAVDKNQNSGEIRTQIGEKEVDIKYENMEDIKGTENGKKITGLDIKIGNMNIKVDEVEIEGLKLEKK